MLLPVFEGEPVECGGCGAIKLLEHVVNIIGKTRGQSNLTKGRIVAAKPDQK